MFSLRFFKNALKFDFCFGLWFAKELDGLTSLTSISIFILSTPYLHSYQEFYFCAKEKYVKQRFPHIKKTF